MNLIEQLGGYEKAKKWLDENNADIKWGYLGDYRRELLDYRRQHNIFEKGDLITHPMFWGLFQVKETMKHHVLGVTPTSYESKLAIQLIRHATPSEIAAGRRLN